MSRNKQRKGNAYNHSEYSIEGGHGGLKRNMGAGASIKPKENTDSGVSGQAMARDAKAGRKGSGASTQAPAAQTEATDSGWAQIGAAGADMVTTYNTRKKANASSGGGSGK